MGSHLSLLEQVGHHRSIAAKNVGHAIVDLQKLSEDLDILRDKLMIPLVTDDDAVPVEVHLATLRKAVSRLAEGSKGTTKG